MSRGPGAIERAIELAFRENPSAVFETDDLVRIAYPGADRIEKKHRVAVLRAGYKAAARNWWQGWRRGKLGGQVVFLNLCDVRSYALGRLRADWLYNRKTLADLAHMIEEPSATHESRGRKYELVQPGGAWHTHVVIHRLERDGRSDEAKTLCDELNGSVAKRVAGLRVSSSRRRDAPSA